MRKYPMMIDETRYRCPVCRTMTAGRTIFHLWDRHKIPILTGGIVGDDVGGMWAECLCGERLPVYDFYAHVNAPDCPCRILYLLMRGD